MENIEIGEYGRTTDGKIAKYIGYNKELELHMFDKGIKWHYEYYTDIFDKDEFNRFINEDIVKHSKYLIDLVEKNDIVNGYRILEIYEAMEADEERILDIGYGYAIFNDEIKTILTKEQYEANCYKVGGEQIC